MICDSWWAAALEGAGISIGVQLLAFGWLLWLFYCADKKERIARMRADD